MMSRGPFPRRSLHSSSLQHFGDFHVVFYTIDSSNQMEHLFETYAFDSTRRPRHCSSSCLWQSGACACTYIHTNTYKQTHSSAEGSRWSLSNRTPFCQTALTMIEIFFGAIRQVVVRVSWRAPQNNRYYQNAEFLLTLNATATQHREVKWNECVIPTCYVNKRHTP